MTSAILLVAEFCEPSERHIVSIFKIIQKSLRKPNEPKCSTSQFKAASKTLGSQPPQSREGTQMIIKSLNALKKSLLSLSSGSKTPKVNELGFQVTEEIFRNSVIIRVY